MIDRAAVRQTLRKPLLAINSALMPNPQNGYAWEGEDFTPPEQLPWIRETLMPIDEGLTSSDAIKLEAFMSYDVFTPKGKGTKQSDAIVKIIGDLFKPASSLTNPATVHIMRSEALPGSVSDAWWMVPVRVRIVAYYTRP